MSEYAGNRVKTLRRIYRVMAYLVLMLSLFNFILTIIYIIFLKGSLTLLLFGVMWLTLFSILMFDLFKRGE